MRKIKLKNNEGITLIALVITIIVLLILSGVAVLMLSGENGILNRTAEAKFKTDVSQIKEHIEIEKTVIIMRNNGEEPETYNPTELFSDINSTLANKYINSGKLEVSEEGNLSYIKDKVSDQEAIWLKDLGIYEKAKYTIKDFAVDKSIDIKVEGTEYIGLENLTTEIETQYPNACVCYAFKGMLTSPRDLGEDAFKDKPIIENNSFVMALIDDFSLFIGYENETFEINSKGEIINEGLDIILMSEEEADKLFKFTSLESTSDVVQEAGVYEYTISSYIGDITEKVEIPSVIYNDSTGNITKVIKQVSDNAFRKTSVLVGVWTLLELDEQGYKDVNISEIYTMIGQTYNGEDTKDINVKNEFLMEYAKNNIGITERDVVIDDNNLMYVYVYEEATYLPVTKVTAISEIIIPSTIENIGKGAFLDQDEMTKVTFSMDGTYWSNSNIKVSSDAFNGCTNLTEINLKNVDTSNSNTITGQDTYWGAPNTNVKITDINSNQ